MLQAKIGSSEQLRILHLIVSVGSSNAQYNEHCLPLMQERDITICSFSKAQVPVPSEITLFEGDGTMRGLLRALRQALGRRSYDVVHAHAPGTGVALLLANLLGAGSMSNAVFTVHNSFQSFRLRSQLLLLPVLARFPRIVFCSHAALESAPRAVRLLAGTDVRVVQNGVDTERVRRALASFNPDGQRDGIVVAAVGRLIPRKDPFTLLTAFRLACGASDRLAYVGDGKDRESLLGEAAARGLTAQVSVSGVVGRDDVYGRLAEADVFVSTSRSEGLPVAVLEAMACGRPVILSDIPPHREIATGADFIPLVPPGDAEGFARELRAFGEMAPKHREELGDRCRDLVESRFSLAEMHRSYLRIYAEVARAGRCDEHDKNGAAVTGDVG